MRGSAGFSSDGLQVAIGSDDGYLHYLTVTSGALQWATLLDSGDGENYVVRGTPVVDSDVNGEVVVNAGSSVWYVAINTGFVDANFDTGFYVQTSPILLANGNVVVGEWKTKGFGLDFI